MTHFDKEYCLEVWGDIACFTYSPLKVERFSYDVITPSAARAIFEAIFWKPAIRWEVTRIEVLAPIKCIYVRCNEVKATANRHKTEIFIEEKRTQRYSRMLKDVRYRIHAKQVFIPVGKRPSNTRAAAPDENPGKYNAIFERRARSGQCFNQPYLGTRECSASFALVENDEDASTPPIHESRDLGLMLYDMDFSNPKDIRPMFFRAEMHDGIIDIPSPDSDQILR